MTVTALSPGPTATGFQARAEMADSKLIAGRRLESGEDVVRAGYAAMRRERPYVVTGTTGKLFAATRHRLKATRAPRQSREMSRSIGWA